MPEFMRRGYYFRTWDPSKKGWDYWYTSEIEAPLTYPYTWPETAVNTKGTTHYFEDLDTQKDVIANGEVVIRHFHQCFIGVAPKSIYYLWHPINEKRLKWHETVEDISEDDTAYIDYERSPLDDPRFERWVLRNKYFGIEPKNIHSQAMKPKVKILAAEIKAEHILDEALLTKLKKHEIPSIPITLEGVD